MSKQAGMGNEVLTVWKSPRWCEREDLQVLTLCVELDFRHILQECVVNRALRAPAEPLLPTKCEFVSRQEPVWSVGKECTGRITPARLWKTSITLAASPACPAVSTASPHPRTQTHTHTWPNTAMMIRLNDEFVPPPHLLQTPSLKHLPQKCGDLIMLSHLCPHLQDAPWETRTSTMSTALCTVKRIIW